MEQYSHSHAVRLFVSYARADQELCLKVIDTLRGQVEAGRITIWFDQVIEPGDDFKHEIEQNLRSAQVVLLMLTQRFLGSSWAMMEARRAWSLHLNQQAVVLPVILEECQWKKEQFAALQALPKNGRPLLAWENTADAVSDIAFGVATAVAKIVKPKPRDDLRLLTSDDIREVIENIDRAIAVIRKEHAQYQTMPVTPAIDLAQLSARREQFYDELWRRDELL